MALGVVALSAGVVHAAERFESGATVLRAAEDGTTRRILGRGFTKSFRSTGEKVANAKIRSAKEPVYKADAHFIDTSLQVAAHATFLFAKAGAKYSANKRYAVLRAYEIDRIELLDGPVPPELEASEFVATKVYYGRSVFIVVEGERHSFSGSVRAGLLGAFLGGELKTYVEKNELRIHTHLRGWRNDTGKPVLAFGVETIKDSFKPGRAVPVFVEYTAVTPIAVEDIPWASDQLVAGTYAISSVSVDVRKRKFDGSVWDHTNSGSAQMPDLEIKIDMNGTEFYLCDKVADSYSATCSDVPLARTFPVDDKTTISIEVRDDDGRDTPQLVGTARVDGLLSMQEARRGKAIPMRAYGRVATASVTLKFVRPTSPKEAAEARRAAADDLNEQGKKYFREVKVEHAVEKFRQAAELSPEGRFYFNLCISLNALRRTAEAIAACNKVTEENAPPDVVGKARVRVEQMSGDRD